MIQERKVYTAICDRCGKDHCEGTEFVGWSCPDGAENMAIESGWEKRENDEHICEDCHVKEGKK